MQTAIHQTNGYSDGDAMSSSTPYARPPSLPPNDFSHPGPSGYLNDPSSSNQYRPQANGPFQSYPPQYSFYPPNGFYPPYQMGGPGPGSMPNYGYGEPFANGDGPRGKQAFFPYNQYNYPPMSMPNGGHVSPGGQFGNYGYPPNMPFYGPNGYPDYPVPPPPPPNNYGSFPPANDTSGRPPQGKMLNPAAEGFYSRPPPQSFNSFNMSQSGFDPGVEAPRDFRPPPSASFSPVLNGHFSPPFKNPPPLHQSGSLGLSHLTSASPSFPPSVAPGDLSNGASSATQSASPETPAQKVFPPTPRNADVSPPLQSPDRPLDLSVAADPKTPPQQSGSSVLKFTDSASVSTSPSVASSSTAPTTQPTSTPGTRPDRTMSSVTTPSSSSRREAPPSIRCLILVSGRPATNFVGNSFAEVLRPRIPGDRPVEQVDVQESPDIKSRNRRIYPSDTGVRLPPNAVAQKSDLSFGSLTLEDTGLAEPSELGPPPRSEASTPIPRSKPVSWAAAVANPISSTRTFSRIATAPLPMHWGGFITSPARSTISLMTEPEVGPSRRSSSPTTPRSPTGELPAQSRALPSELRRPTRRAPINYAAAAASHASPYDDLAKLLTFGAPPAVLQRLKGAGVMPRGLINTGNMCFANTVLQVLVYCLPFQALFEEVGRKMKADLARRTPLTEAIIIFLREFSASQPGSGTTTPGSTNEVKSKNREGRREKEAFVPENVYDALKENRRFDSIRRGFQEDAEEFLGFFLNTLHEELLLVYSRSIPSSLPNGNPTSPAPSERSIERPVSPSGDDGTWHEVGKKQKTNVVRQTSVRESAISRIFGGTLRSILHIPGSKDSVTLEPYQPLQLDIGADNIVTVEDALRHISEPEIVRGVWSASRGEEVDATKQVYVETWPQILILHLKRFVYESGDVVKRAKPIAYSTELVVPPEIVTPARRSPVPIKYKLFGAIYHHGTSASGGHYTVSVSRTASASGPTSTGWLHFDDETVTPVPAEDVVVSAEEAERGRSGLIGGREKTVYLLFYERLRG